MVVLLSSEEYDHASHGDAMRSQIAVLRQRQPRRHQLGKFQHCNAFQASAPRPVVRSSQNCVDERVLSTGVVLF